MSCIIILWLDFLTVGTCFTFPHNVEHKGDIINKEENLPPTLSMNDQSYLVQ